MAKRKTPQAENVHSARDAMFGQIRLKHLEGHEETRKYYLPLPAFCLSWLLSSSCFELSRSWHLHGPKESGKSAFGTDIVRWHMIFGGGGYVAQNENKDYPEMREGIWLHHPVWLNRSKIEHTAFVEEWQLFVKQTLEHSRERMDAAGGMGRAMPLCWLIDSLVGTGAKADIDKVIETGYGQVGFLAAPMIITRYLKSMPYLLRNFPFSLVFTNHGKPAMAQPGKRLLPGQEPPITTPGGQHLGYAETYELAINRVSDIDAPLYSGIRSRFRCLKNSAGVGRRQLMAELIWWWADVNGQRRQFFAWDWHTATIELLLSFQTMAGTKKWKKDLYFNGVQDILGLGVHSKSGRRGWCDKLGVPKSDPQPYRVLGRLLQNNAELLTQLYTLFNIRDIDPIMPEADAYVKEAGFHEAQNLYAMVGDSMPETEGPSQLDAPEFDAEEAEGESADVEG